MFKLWRALSIIFLLQICSLTHAEMRPCEANMTAGLAFPSVPFLTKIYNVVQSEKSAISATYPDLTSQTVAEGYLAIQDWMRRFHGLKVPLLSLDDQASFFTDLFLEAIRNAAVDKKPSFFALSEALQSMSMAQQLALFSELRDQVRFSGDYPKYLYAAEVLLSVTEKAKAEKRDLVEVYRDALSKADEIAQNSFAAHYPPLFSETFAAQKSGKIKLDADGRIPYGEDGVPERYTYTLGLKLRRNSTWPHYRMLLPKDQVDLIEALMKAPQATLTHAFEDPHYKKLLEFRYSEIIGSGVYDAPIWSYLNPGDGGSPRYRHARNSTWWMNFSIFSEVLPDGTLDESLITAQSTLSPAVELYGPNVERVVHWPRDKWTKERPFDPDLTRLRIIENRDKITKHVYSVEVLANRAAGEPPVGFFLVNIAGDLVPAKVFDGLPVHNSEACLKCHATFPGSGIMSFKPTMLNSTQAFHDRGFRDPTIIHKLLNSH